MNPDNATMCSEKRGFSRIGFGVWIALVLVLVTFVAPFVSYACKHATADMNPLYFIIGIVLGLVCGCGIVLSGKMKIWQHLERGSFFRTFLVGASACLFILQLFVVYGAGFITGWDVSYLVAPDLDVPEIASYFSMYSNQLFLAGLFQRILNACAVIGFEGGYYALVVGGCLCVTLSIAFMTLVARKLANTKSAILFFFVAIVFIGFSPWILVPYSDTFGMFWTSLALWIYVCGKSRYLKWPAFFGAVCIGYCIKPTVLFVGLAVVLVEAVQSFRKMRADYIKGDVCFDNKRARLLIINFVLILAVLIAALFFIKMVSLPDDNLDNEKSFGPAHFLMLGLNSESGGVWNISDIEYSESFDTSAERTSGNLNRAAQRLEAMGPWGTLELLAKKVCTNFADGSFAWETEGDFYKDARDKIDPLQRFYGINDLTAPNPFEPIAQTLWFMVLVGCLIGCFFPKRSTAGIRAICLVLLMLSIFVLFFEARARYLFLYAPYFVLLASVGWTTLGKIVTAKSLK